MYRLQFVASCNTVRRSAAIGNLALTFSFTVFLPFESWKKQRVSSTSLLPNSSTKCTVQYMLYNSFSTEPKIDCSCARARSRAPFLFRWREERK
ncbi:hypothetical protein Mapa_012244 [Marchantia paleacea]|nr:hypothetical protein Mapa_012244 [Marchantia paleacea]